MANIPVYDVPQAESELRIPEGGAAALAIAGRRVGAGGAEAAHDYEQGFSKLAAGVGDLGQSIDAAQTAKETSQILPRLALDQQQRMQELNGIAYGNNPNDIATKLTQYRSEVLDPAKEQFLSSFTTTKAKEAAGQAWGRHEAELYNHAAAVSIQAAGDATHNNLIGGINQLTANVGKDPSLLDHNLELADAAINGAANTTVSPEARHIISTNYAQTAKTDMVTNAIKTTAENNPAAARAMIAGGKYDAYIGAHVGTLNTYIDTQEKLIQSRAKADDVQQRQIEGDTAKEAITNAVAGTITPQGIKVGPDYFRAVQDVITMPGAQRNPELVKAFVDYGQAALDRQQKGVKAVTDQTTFNDFASRMFKDPTDPNALTYPQLYTAAAAGKLSDHDVSFFNQAVEKNNKSDMLAQGNTRMMESVFSTAKQVLNPSADNPFASIDPEAKARGALDMANYTRVAQQEWNAGLAKGESPAVIQQRLTDPTYIQRFRSNPAETNLYGATAPTPKKPDAASFWNIFGGTK